MKQQYRWMMSFCLWACAGNVVGQTPSNSDAPSEIFQLPQQIWERTHIAATTISCQEPLTEQKQTTIQNSAEQGHSAWMWKMAEIYKCSNNLEMAQRWFYRAVWNTELDMALCPMKETRYFLSYMIDQYRSTYVFAEQIPLDARKFYQQAIEEQWHTKPLQAEQTWACAWVLLHYPDAVEKGKKWLYPHKEWKAKRQALYQKRMPEAKKEPNNPYNLSLPHQEQWEPSPQE